MRGDSIYTRKESFSLQGGYIVMYEAPAAGDLADTVPLFFIPGWGASPLTVQNFVSELTSLGRTVFVLDHEHLDSCENKLMERYLDVPCLEYNKAYGLSTIITRKNLKEVDILSHSEGAVAAIVAAHMNPSNFRHVVLINPAGLLKKDSLIRLSMRFLFAIYHHIHFSKGKVHALSVTLWLNVLWYVLWNPVQSLREAFRLPYCDIRKYILETASKNVCQISAITAVSDRVFPHAQILTSLKSIPEINITSIPGNHIGLYLNPKAFATAVQKVVQK